MAQDALSAWPDDALEVGRIGAAWGLNGDFRVLPYADPPTALLAAARWHLRPADDFAPRAAIAPLPPTLEIARVRARGDGFVASSPAVTDRTAAEALRGARIFIARSRFPAPGSDEFYWVDLIGMAVSNRDGVHLGSVVGLLDRDRRPLGHRWRTAPASRSAASSACSTTARRASCASPRLQATAPSC